MALVATHDHLRKRGSGRRSSTAGPVSLRLIDFLYGLCQKPDQTELGTRLLSGLPYTRGGTAKP